MGASIHISGTGSSIIDTIFVCRSTGAISKKWLPDSIEGVADLVAEDLARLREGGVKPTPGDARCVTYGHLIRLAVCHLRNEWDKNKTVSKKLAIVADWLRKFRGYEEDDPDDQGEGLYRKNARPVGRTYAAQGIQVWHETVLKDREEAFLARKVTVSDWDEAKRKSRIKKKVSHGSGLQSRQLE